MRRQYGFYPKRMILYDAPDELHDYVKKKKKKIKSSVISFLENKHVLLTTNFIT